MVKARNKEPPPATQILPNQPASPPQIVNLISMDAVQYAAMIARLDRLESYVGSLAQTYEIRDGSGAIVNF